jgi:DNA polymerase III alpha subunit|tara:strand:- start:55 stop:822 length:768 start_codon:yes stop_codon:yes gene_type:complete
MEEVVPFFKSHYSLGRSILTLDIPKEEKDKGCSDSIFEIAQEADLKDIFLVEDSITGFLEAYTNAQELNKKLIFGLRLTFCPDCLKKNEEGRKNSFKNIIFIKNEKGYKQLIKIYTYAAQDGFYYEPRIDFNTLKKFWTDDLILAIPFYDSFLYNNKYTDSQCVPDFSFTNPVFIKEDNDTLLDEDMQDSVDKFCSNKYDILNAKSIYYKSKNDFGAYLTFRCINKRTSIEKPNFDGMCSDQFCYESYKEAISNG